MTTIYKLTDKSMQTHNGFQWTLNKTETADGKGDLCGPGFLHAYTDPLLAVLLNPIHANIDSPRLFRADGTIKKTDHGLKAGCMEMTLLEELPLPAINSVQRIAFGILCAKEVCKDADWVTWADNWLSGKDRTAEAARAARAARAAEAEAEAAAEAAEAVWAETAAAEAAEAVWAETAAAEAAAEAAEAGAIDLITIARKAMEVK